MRYLPVILIFFHFGLFGQSNGEWKPLPNVKGTKAIINRRPAVIDTIVTKERAPKIEEIPNLARLEFISKVIPDTLETVSFKSYPLSSTKKEAVPNGLIFKDNACYNIKYLDKAHGLPNNLIRSIAEDKNGLIYMASESGLLIFNGSEIEIYEDNPFFSFTRSKSLYNDRTGRMWIASDEQIGYIIDGKLYLPENQIFGGVHQQPFSEDDNGDFFISTNFNGLFIIKRDFTLHYNSDLPHNMIADAIRTSDGKLWFAFARHGVGFIKNDSLFAYKEFGDYNNSRAFLEQNGELWIGNFAAPLLKFRNDSLFTVKLNVKTNYVYTLEQNSKGVWLAVYGAGVFLIKPNGEYHRFYTENGLSGNSSFDLFIDSFENVWIADIFNGISRIDENLFYKKLDNRYTSKINETETDSDGNYWHFRSGERLTKETPDSYITYGNIPDAKFLNHMHSQDGFIREDGVWMGSFDMGIIRLKDMEFTYYWVKYNGHNDNSLFHLEYDDAGGIWSTTVNDDLMYLFNDRFYNFSNGAEWKDFEFLKVIKTNGGEIFATTRKNGLFQIKNGRYRKIPLLESLNSAHVHHVFKDLSNNFWFFMNNEIQMMKSDGSVLQFVNPIFNNSPIVDLIEIEKDNFLGVNNGGIISIKRNSEELKINRYGRENGLYLVDNIAVHQKSNGQISIYQSDGLIVCDSMFVNKKSPPKLSFNRVEIDSDSLHVVDGTFTTDQGKQIRLVFNKIFWGNSSTLHYKLNHNNKDGNWSEQSSNALTFQELSYGNYQLTVYSMGDNMKSKELKYAFTISPYWYQTAWSKLLFVSLIVGFVITYFLYRERQARVVKQQLEGLIREKTSELASQLEQKEILMQEVHHRVKNNLTFLKSLLYLRSKASEDDNVKMILDECQTRIQSMALVHQNLYDTEDVSMVDFHSFLKELFYEIESLFGQDKASINIDIDVNDLKIDMKLSIFLGLILNEMITNSYKYAFAQDSPGQIKILLKDMGGQFQLQYGDSGNGLPQDFDIQNSTGFGFKLIKILLSQINGEMLYEKNDMSTFNILIPNGK